MTNHPRKKDEVTPTQRMLNTWAIVLIIWALFRHHFKESLPIWMDEFIAKPVIFIIPLYYYITHFEIKLKGKHHEIGDAFVKQFKYFVTSLGITLRNWKFDIGMALFIGAIFIGFGAYANMQKFGQITSPESKFLKEFTPYMLIAIAFASATWEEILARGFVLKRLLEEKMNWLYAIFFNSFLYFFTHIPILFTSSQITGYLILQVLAMDVIFSVMVSSLFLYKRSTLLAILVHAIYNISLYFFL